MLIQGQTNYYFPFLVFLNREVTKQPKERGCSYREKQENWTMLFFLFGRTVSRIQLSIPASCAGPNTILNAPMYMVLSVGLYYKEFGIFVFSDNWNRAAPSRRRGNCRARHRGRRRGRGRTDVGWRGSRGCAGWPSGLSITPCGAQ
jgi:hypothetical protein